MTESIFPSRATIHAKGDRSIAARTVGAATTGDHSPIIRLDPGTLKAPAEVTLHRRLTNLPQAPSAVFVGRETALAFMAQALGGTSAQVAIGQVIQGMGGVGKSELARQYVARHSQCYPLVWWITATSEEQINVDLATLAERVHPPLPQASALSTVLGIEQAAQWALNWLQAHDEWLLILDNVDDPMHIGALLAQLRNGRIVITTRRHVTWPAEVTRLPLDLLSKGAATELLALISERTVDPQEWSAYEAIADELGYLPLALEQAGAYIRESQISPQEYQRLLAAHPLEMYDIPREGGEVEQTIARLWNAHLDVIRSRNPHAEQVLRVLACYAPDDIPRYIVGGIAAASGLQVTNALRLLASYHLIKMKDKCIVMHRLLQKVVAATEKTRADTATNALSFPEMALAWLAEAWSAAAALPPQQQAGRCRVLSPHAENLTRHHPVTTMIGEHDWVFTAATVFEDQQGNYHRAESLARHDIALAIISRGEKHPDTLIKRASLASALRGLGRLEEAEAECRAVLDVQRQVLGDEHPDMPAIRNILAVVLRRLGRLEEAEAEFRAVLDIQRQVLGDEHPYTSGIRNNLAVVLWESGRLEEAKAEFQAVLEARRRVLSDEHPDTLTTQNNLANALQDLGRLEEAKAEHQAVLEARRRVLSDEHPDTLVSRANLAGILRDLGLLEEAETEYRAVLDVQRRVLNDEHQDTLTLRSNLAGVLQLSGRLKEAETEHRAVLDIRRRVLSDEHPDTLASRANLADVLQDLGRLEEAETEYRVVLEARQRRLGDEHPDTLILRNNLAGVLRLSGRLKEAETECRAVLDVQRRRLGDEHPNTLALRNNLARVLRLSGRLEEAKAELQMVLDIRQRVLGDKHPNTLAARKNLNYITQEKIKLQHTRARSNMGDLERNKTCSCGSRKKYKRCHGRTKE